MISSTPSYLRKINKRRIIESVLRLRRASRAQLSRVSGISSPTVSRIVDDLLTSGVLMEADALDRADPASARSEVASVGRPSAPLELDNRRSRFLAIQLGVRQTRIARAPIALPEQDSWEAEFETPNSAALWSEQLARQAGRLPIGDLQAIVVSLPGVVDESNGIAKLSPNLRWLESANLQQIIDRVVTRHPRLLVLQEIRALALGHLAASPEIADFLLVDFGTGVGGAAVVGGALYTGPLPLSGEVGHTPVIGNDRLCGCGSTGCVETLASRRGMLMSAQEKSGINDWSALVKHVTDEGIPGWMTETLNATAVCIAASLNVLGLREVVITGSMAEMPQKVIDYLGQKIRDDTLWARFGTIEIGTAKRRRLAGMIHHAISRTLLSPTAD